MARPGRPHAARRARLATTARGRWLGASGLVFLAAGGVFETPGIAAFGAIILSLLASAHLTAVLARQRVAKAAARLVGAPPALKLWEGRSQELELVLELPRRTAVFELELTPNSSEALEARLVGVIDAPPETKGQARFRLAIVGRRLGDSFLQGFEVSATVALGLYAVQAFAPCFLRATVLPRHMAAGQPSLRPTRAAAEEQADLVHREKRGFGMEIRELRDFVPGDPFKHIAWSASARRGKLIAREFESDLQLSIWILVDCSPSMFWGPPGAAKIDHALELAADLARSLTSGRDRVGLVLHDHESRLLVEPGHGSAHRWRLTQALLEAPHLVHDDRTELTDSELVLRVARWFEVHEGASFPPQPGRQLAPAERSTRPPDGPGPSLGPALGVPRTMPSERVATPLREPHPRLLEVDEAALARACREALLQRFAKSHPVLPFTAYALDPQRSTLRAFARHFGIALPRDPTPRPGGQSHGLEAALQAVLSAHGHAGAHTLLSISDFHTADDLEALRRVALIARRHRHSLAFVMPTGERGVLPAGSFTKRSRDARLMSALVEVTELQENENLRAAQAILRPAGATFVTTGASDSLARVLAKLRSVA